jgi:hypothetical protein
MTCVITQWYGRFGNNIIQLSKALQICKIENIKTLSFPSHPMLDSVTITLEGESFAPLARSGLFFYEDHKLDPKDIRELCIKYITPILRLKPIDNYTDIVVHLRGGDIFSNNPHPAYVQPPLSYYKNILSSRPATIVYEDTKNPCFFKLRDKPNTLYHSGTLEDDFNLLLHAKEVVAGFGTFCLAVYMLSTHIKVLHLPQWFYDTCPQGDWGDVKVHTHKIDGYIKPGEWKNTPEQIDIMLNF